MNKRIRRRLPRHAAVLSMTDPELRQVNEILNAPPPVNVWGIAPRLKCSGSACFKWLADDREELPLMVSEQSPNVWQTSSKGICVGLIV